MTVPQQPTRTTHVGNGVTTVFAYNFLCFTKPDLQVIVAGAVIDPSAYTVSNLGQNSGGDVTFNAPPANQAQVVIQLNMALQRQTDYQTNGDLFAKTVNFDFDRLWLAIQQAFGYIDRVPRLGEMDVDGAGAYRAKGNRIQDLGTPVNGRDATTKQWVQEQISNAAIDGAGQFVVDRMADREDVLNGAGMVGFRPEGMYPIGTAGYSMEAVRHTFDKPAVQSTQFNPAITYSDNDYTNYVDSFGDSLYRHSPRIVRDATGMYHMVYSRGKMHGYGGLSEANAVDPEGKIIYVNSWDLINWSPEQIICLPLPPDPGLNPFRTVFDCHIGVTQSGVLGVVISDIPPPSEQWGRYTGNTKYRIVKNTQRGQAGAWTAPADFFEATGDYARIYSGSIKCVPKLGGGWRMAFADYRRVSPTAVTVGMFVSDDEFETLPVRIADILTSAGNTETDFDMVDERLGFAVSRGDFATAITTDGMQSWTVIGTSANFDRTITGGTGLIAPVMKAVRHQGDPFLLVGWSERGVSPRSIRWVSASVRELMAFRDAVAASQTYTPWTTVSQSGPAFTGSGGYHSPIVFEDGSCVYVDTTDTTADPVTGLMRAQLRVVRFGVQNLLPRQYGPMIGSKRSRLGQYNEDEIPYVPSLIGTTTTGTGTYVSRLGTTTRVGNICNLQGSFNLTGLSGFAGSLRIDGLPFQSMSNQTQLVDVMLTSAMGGSWNTADRVRAAIPPQANYMVLYKQLASNNSLVGLTPADIGTAFTITIAGHYRCRFPGLQ